MTDISIRTFLTILETGSISAAAEVLYMSQPAISKRMKQLEEELGYQLFYRDKGIRNIQLTEDGRIFASNAEKILALFATVQRTPEKKQPETLHLSLPSVLDDAFIKTAFDRLQLDFPNYHFILHTRHSYDAYRNIENGTLDIAIVTRLRHHTKVNFIPILHEGYVLLTRNDFYIQKETIKSSDLNPEMEILMPWNFSYANWHTYWFGEDARPFVKIDRLSLVSYFMKSNQHWALVPISTAYSLCEDASLTIRKLEDGPPELILYMIQKKQPNTFDLLQKFAPYFSQETTK